MLVALISLVKISKICFCGVKFGAKFEVLSLQQKQFLSVAATKITWNQTFLSPFGEVIRNRLSSSKRMESSILLEGETMASNNFTERRQNGFKICTRDKYATHLR